MSTSRNPPPPLRRRHPRDPDGGGRRLHQRLLREHGDPRLGYREPLHRLPRPTGGDLRGLLGDGVGTAGDPHRHAHNRGGAGEVRKIRFFIFILCSS